MIKRIFRQYEFVKPKKNFAKLDLKFTIKNMNKIKPLKCRYKMRRENTQQLTLIFITDKHYCVTLFDASV